MEVDEAIRLYEQNEMKDMMETEPKKKRNCAFIFALIFVIAVCVLLFALPAKAGHTGVEFLKDKQFVSQGICGIATDTNVLTVKCEMYVGKDGTPYVALYYEGRVQVVKRQNPDGTDENVYVRTVRPVGVQV